MHPLRRSDTGEFSLVKDLVGDNKIPLYAILSHTWGADTDKVTFEDLINSTGKDKPGYKKAINSIFRWYRDATRCYVYLSDPWESDFRNSKWFTRGWTLQELLAPSLVESFSWERKRLGDKRSLTQQIYEITGIPKSALQGAALSQFGVTERLSWIKHRHTKLEEDAVYSLLGIFDISMPLIYGEGRDKAFKRLRRRSIKPWGNFLKDDQECIQYLRLTDPRDDKKRIEDTKGGLLKDSYR
ncbi:hypothetical protein CC78DRAFT_559541 [Lojkania enalia]|uniref:Heterokaryon incompatibility domain-containing protein n=1 Tax=Lojkania enalia TaxID=147567 RepID=A0A9P4KB94_9PLEO|nr:hypothetical protein CC78DRAFT_559541 [Didymosphaeria enalia]